MSPRNVAKRPKTNSEVTFVNSPLIASTNTALFYVITKLHASQTFTEVETSDHDVFFMASVNNSMILPPESWPWSSFTTQL